MRDRPPGASTRLAISARDARIIDGALDKLGDTNVSFADALRALREAVEEQIPDGRVFLLGNTAHGPIVGSLVSGVGIVDSPAGIRLVHTNRGNSPNVLGSFLR